MNCQFRPFPRIQWRVTVLLNQPWTLGSGKSVSDLGMVRFLLANLAFAATRVCVIPSSWCRTKYIAAAKTGSSNERTGC